MNNKKGTPLWKALLFEHRLPWRYNNLFDRLSVLFLTIKIKTINHLITRLKFSFKKPLYRIVLSTNFFGGIGGVERRVKSVVESMTDYEFYIFAREIIPRGFIPKTHNYFLNLKKSQSPKFDIYLYFSSCIPEYLGNKFEFDKKIVITNGANITKFEALFDYIFLDGINCKNFCKDYKKCRIALPSVNTFYPEKYKYIKNLPKKFLLTIFNPYHKIKGHHIMYKVAQNSKLPIVWCYNNTTFKNFKDIEDIKNIIHLKNISQEELYYLYSKAEAYISFSLSESFGWSLADAIFFDLPIITRNVGIITLFSKQKGIYVYENEDDLVKYLSISGFLKPKYDKKIFNKFSYLKQINNILIQNANK